MIVRRFCAVLLALCLGLFSAESLIADVHHGHVSVRVQSGHTGVVRASLSESGASDDAHTHTGSDSSGHDGHVLHTCHGAHMHAGLVAAGVSLVAPSSGRVHVLSQPHGVLLRPDLPSFLRPPIA